MDWWGVVQVGLQNWILCPSTQTHVKTSAAAATFPECSECSSGKCSANGTCFKWLSQWLCQRQHSPQSLWLVCMKLVWLSCNMLQHLTSKFWYHSDFHPLEVSWIRLRWCGTAIAADTSIRSAQKLLPLSNPARSLAIYFHILYIMELRVHEEKVILQVAWFSIVFD